MTRLLSGSTSGGDPLPEPVQADMGSRFGVDFGGVRVHTGTEADELNREVEATAFTTGSDIFFSRGAYDPGSASGRELLAHELTHVVQQDTGTIQRAGGVSRPEDREEVQARQVARAVAAGSVADVLAGAGNHAVARLVQREEAEPAGQPETAGPPVGGEERIRLSFPKTTVAKPKFAYGQVDVAIGANLTYTAKPAGDEGELATVSSTTTTGPDSSSYQLQVEHKFKEIAEEWGAGYTPKVSIAGEKSSTGGYKLALEGAFEGELTEFGFGFAFLESEGDGEVTFGAVEFTGKLKPHPVTLTMEDGSVLEVTAEPELTLKLTPDYDAVRRMFLEKCAEAVTADVAIIGGMVAAGVATIAGTLLTIDDGDEMARVVDEAAKARTDFVDAFMAGITPGADYQADNDYKMEGYLEGTQWLRNLQDGTAGSGLPIPESVLKQKVAEHEAQARANATAAVTAYLHEQLVQWYWQTHWGAKLMGTGIEPLFLRVMEAAGFSR